ncbi:hypothetical protein SELR_pSRC101730 (plasmid) [Selenomonas ruminantium subsp. lactilytica TAM6421]|uniref:Uncharacterized protein n=1 Tax=Selenomonas ruminantium subsp. lactilytica (strain NBRC 103574 / TAM6421) TaxID=927704 RepID=I0GW43_SELRL|nr:hypothetical protein [Selenomonas ruminantium]BAL84980.1 hypothetical protein SELR_pSRC101730 [Selenomonas ruminantium subsp. lactilytica TAM6421]
MSFLSSKQKQRLIAASLSLACLGAMGTVMAADTPQPPALNGMGQPPAPPDGKRPPAPPPDGKFGGMQEKQNDASNLKATQIVDGVTSDVSNNTLANDNTDENVLLVRNNGSLTAKDDTLTKNGDSSSADASNFTGQNAIILVNNSTADLENLNLSSNGDGANGIFATGEKAQIQARHIKIHTKNNSSRGLDATYGGTINAEDVDIITEGAHCGALATDRGEGNIIVKDAKIQTSGEGSPCIYSTGNIQLTNGNGEATGSEIAVVEGKNSITLKDSTLTGHVKHGVMLYQSFSEDANVGTAQFTAVNSTLNNQSDGPVFYITNTTATATLENTTLNQSGDILVKVTSDRWGSEGKNGGDFTLKAKNQLLTGQILANNISKVTLELGSGSTFTGTINKDYQAEAANVSLKNGANWNLTADAYVTTITDEQQDFHNIQSNKHNIYYDKSANPHLNGQSIKLPGGGQLRPR